MDIVEKIKEAEKQLLQQKRRPQETADRSAQSKPCNTVKDRRKSELDFEIKASEDEMLLSELGDSDKCIKSKKEGSSFGDSISSAMQALKQDNRTS